VSSCATSEDLLERKEPLDFFDVGDGVKVSVTKCIEEMYQIKEPADWKKLPLAIPAQSQSRPMAAVSIRRTAALL